MYFPDGHHAPNPKNILRDGIALLQFGDTIYLTFNDAVVDTFDVSYLLTWLSDNGNLSTHGYAPLPSKSQPAPTDYPEQSDKPAPTDYPPLKLTVEWSQPVYRSDPNR